MKTITLQFDESKNSIRSGCDQPITFEEFSFVLFNSILAFGNHVLEQIPEDQQDKKPVIKGMIYDQINIAASNILQTFAPELELRPNLTEEAILKAENDIIHEHTAEELHEKYD